MSSHGHALNKIIEKEDLIGIIKATLMFIAGFFLWALEFAFIKEVYGKVFSTLVVYAFGEYLTPFPHGFVVIVALIYLIVGNKKLMGPIMLIYFISFILQFSF